MDRRGVENAAEGWLRLVHPQQIDLAVAVVLRLAKEAGVRLRAELVSNDRNRQMLITYRFAGFREVGREGETSILENDYSALQPPPRYVELKILGS